MANWTVQAAANNLADVQSALEGEIDPGALHRLYPNLSEADLGEVAERALAIADIRAAGSDAARQAAIDAELARRAAAGQPARLVLDSLITFETRTGQVRHLTARVVAEFGSTVDSIRAQVEQIIGAWNATARVAGSDVEIDPEEVVDQFWWIG